MPDNTGPTSLRPMRPIIRHPFVEETLPVQGDDKKPTAPGGRQSCAFAP